MTDIRSKRVEANTDHFETKLVHGQMVRVRILKPHKAEEDDEPPRRKRPKKKLCKYCETEIFDPGKACDLCGQEF